MNSTIAFIGLGRMGCPMAANLVKAGYRVVGFDVVDACRGSAEDVGVILADSAESAVAGAGFVITMLPSARHVLSVVDEVSLKLMPGAVFVDASTIDVESARLVEATLRAKGSLVLDAPVSGGTVGASDGTLTFMVGGAAEAVEAARPVLESMGKRVVHCGGAGSGQAAKICNNMLTGISMAAVCEAFVLGERLGVSHDALFAVASTSSGQCWSLTSYCPVPGPVPSSPANNEYRPGFATSLMLKDLRLAQDAALRAGASTPLGAMAAQLYGLFEQLGNANVDFSGLINVLREKAAQHRSAE